MPRVARREIETIYDPVADEMKASLARMPERSPAQQRAAEEASARFMRRVEKARQRWRAMSLAEQRAWTTAHVAEQRRRYSSTPSPKAADLPMLYAIVTVCAKDNAKQAEARKRALLESEEERRRDDIAKATRAKPRLLEPPVPAMTVADEEPRRKRRKGPRYGVVALQLPDGTMRARIYDQDDY